MARLPSAHSSDEPCGYPGNVTGTCGRSAVKLRNSSPFGRPSSPEPPSRCSCRWSSPSVSPDWPELHVGGAVAVAVRVGVLDRCPATAPSSTIDTGRQRRRGRRVVVDVVWWIVGRCVIVGSVVVVGGRLWDRRRRAWWSRVPSDADSVLVGANVFAGFFGAESVRTTSPVSVCTSKLTSVDSPVSQVAVAVTLTGVDPPSTPPGSAERALDALRRRRCRVGQRPTRARDALDEVAAADQDVTVVGDVSDRAPEPVFSLHSSRSRLVPGLSVQPLAAAGSRSKPVGGVESMSWASHVTMPCSVRALSVRSSTEGVVRSTTSEERQPAPARRSR